MWALCKEFLLFLRQEKKWWLVPLVVLLVLLVPSLAVGLGASRNRCVLPHAGTAAGADVAASSR